MLKTLASAVVDRDFPQGTVDPGFTFTVTGAQADGTPFAQSVNSPTPAASFDLPPGSYIGVVSKLGISSLPSTELVIEVPTVVTLSVPDETQAAIFS